MMNCASLLFICFVTFFIGCSIATHGAGHLDFQLKFNKTCAEVNRTGAEPPMALSIELENATCTTHTVQTVMESAADTDRAYKFTVSYVDKRNGYDIQVLSGLQVAEDCDWYLFYKELGQSKLQYQQYANISTFEVSPNSTVLLSYEPEPTIPPSPSPSATPSPNNNGGVPTSFGFLNLCLALLLGAMAALY